MCFSIDAGILEYITYVNNNVKNYNSDVVLNNQFGK